MTNECLARAMSTYGTKADVEPVGDQCPLSGVKRTNFVARSRSARPLSGAGSNGSKAMTPARRSPSFSPSMGHAKIAWVQIFGNL
jgi:hypothetical protein